MYHQNTSSSSNNNNNSNISRHQPRWRWICITIRIRPTRTEERPPSWRAKPSEAAWPTWSCYILHQSCGFFCWDTFFCHCALSLQSKTCELDFFVKIVNSHLVYITASHTCQENKCTFVICTSEVVFKAFMREVYSLANAVLMLFYLSPKMKKFSGYLSKLCTSERNSWLCHCMFLIKFCLLFICGNDLQTFEPASSFSMHFFRLLSKRQLAKNKSVIILYSKFVHKVAKIVSCSSVAGKILNFAVFSRYCNHCYSCCSCFFLGVESEQTFAQGNLDPCLKL